MELERRGVVTASLTLMAEITTKLAAISREAEALESDGGLDAVAGAAGLRSEVPGLEFEQALRRAKKLTRPYDCLIPLSGGKDSAYLAHLGRFLDEVAP